jgi:hypothetical protein
MESRKQFSSFSHNQGSHGSVLKCDVLWWDAGKNKMRGCYVQISSEECSTRLGEQCNIRKTVRECVLFMLCVFALTPPFLSFLPTFAYRDKGFRVRVRVRVRVNIYANG